MILLFWDCSKINIIFVVSSWTLNRLTIRSEGLLLTEHFFSEKIKWYPCSFPCRRKVRRQKKKSSLSKGRSLFRDRMIKSPGGRWSSSAFYSSSHSDIQSANICLTKIACQVLERLWGHMGDMNFFFRKRWPGREFHHVIRQREYSAISTMIGRMGCTMELAL